MGGAAKRPVLVLVTALFALSCGPASADHPGQTGAARLSTAVEPTIAAKPADTVRARRHFFGAANVDASGRVPRDRVILSWFSVASLAAAIDGHVVLLDTYIHKGEDRPGYVPTTTNELVALEPEAVFIGHGHFDHANTGGAITARTGALLVGAPEHCDQARQQATKVPGGARVRCMAAVGRASLPGAEFNEIRPLGGEVGITVFKHLHSAFQPPDGEGHETSIGSLGLPDANPVLLHPPGPGTIGGLTSSGDEGASLLYQFRVGQFSLTWHDTVGPLRERNRGLFGLLRRLPSTDVELGSTLGFNDPGNGQRDPVDYMVTLKPKLFFPVHHDFVAEYGLSKGLEGVFRREAAKRGRVPTEIRWLQDPRDYLRPELMTFKVEAPRFANAGACLSRRAAIGPRGAGRIRLGLTRAQLLRRAPAPRRRAPRAWRWCVKRSGGTVRAAFSRSGRVRLVASTAARHGNGGVRPGVRARRLHLAYPRRRALGRGLFIAAPGSARLVGVRGGRVRFTGVASRTLIADRRSLRRLLRAAGL